MQDADDTPVYEPERRPRRAHLYTAETIAKAMQLASISDAERVSALMHLTTLDAVPWATTTGATCSADRLYVASLRAEIEALHDQANRMAYVHPKEVEALRTERDAALSALRALHDATEDPITQAECDVVEAARTAARAVLETTR